jgi:hypothetical protein
VRHFYFLVGAKGASPDDTTRCSARRIIAGQKEGDKDEGTSPKPAFSLYGSAESVPLSEQAGVKILSMYTCYDVIQVKLNNSTQLVNCMLFFMPHNCNYKMAIT